MHTSDFDFVLPPELIAQTPAAERDQSRLLVLQRNSGQIANHRFGELRQFLRPGDLLVLNNSRVIPARLRGVNAKSGGRFEVLLLDENQPNDWWVMLRPGKRARIETRIDFQDANGNPSGVQAMVIDQNEEGHRRLVFTGTPNLHQMLDKLGEVPLPPYITRTGADHREQDQQRYQTVYAQSAGSVAAPTAGLHFTTALLDELRAHGVGICCLTLHVGLGTFAPVKVETLDAHIMHHERYELCDETATAINQAKRSARRVIAVGTTTVRVLESVAAKHQGQLIPGNGRTDIFIYPPYPFRIVDSLLTNFHLPRSTLLMLVSAFATPNQTNGRELIMSAYAEAVNERYRFFSYGDAMLIL